jgi:hypothetical protein
MGLPSDFPPAEIIRTLETELGLDFQYFMVSLEGDIEALFASETEQQIVTFETKRTMAEYEIPSIDSIMETLDDDAIHSVKEALKEIVNDLDSKEIPMVEARDNFHPEFDEEWYCP